MVDIYIPGIIAEPEVGIPSVETPVVSEFEQIIYHDDLENVFFNVEEFAMTISYYHSSLDEWVEYSVIYDDPHASVSLGTAVTFNSLRPQFQISEAELLHPVLKNDRCIVKGKRYRIDDFMSDGVGVTTVYLRIK